MLPFERNEIFVPKNNTITLACNLISPFIEWNLITPEYPHTGFMWFQKIRGD